jgi:colicin import membrane protein
MAESTEIAVVAQETPAAPQQLMTIEPKVYVDLVFEPFVKRYADGVDAVREVAYDIKTTAGMAVAVKFRALFRAIRTESENARKLRKAPILEIGRLLDSRKGEIEAVSLPLETMFDDEIKAEEQRKDAEKQAKAAIEKARVDAIQAKIDEIRRAPAAFALKTAAELKAEADRLSETVISLDEFAELSGEAMQARNKAVEQLRDLQETAEEMEARQARLAEERAQLDRDREEAAERDRLAAVARAEQEEHDRAERERVEAQQRAAHEEEQRKLADQRREFEQQQAAQQAAADKLNAATSEIQGIQQQVIIATQGRLGVRKGGTIECLRDTLAETEAWDIDQERFGILAAAAESAKTTAVAEIRRR